MLLLIKFFHYSLFRQNTYLRNKKHTLTCQGGIGYYKAVTTSPVVSWRGWGTLPPPPPPPQRNGLTVILCSTTVASLSVCSCPSSAFLFTFWWMDWCLFNFINLSIFYLNLVSYVKRIKDLSWGGEPKMWRFSVLLGQGSPLNLY